MKPLMLQAEQVKQEATNDVAFKKNGIKHKLTASGRIRNGRETTNYWNSRDKVVLETDIPASLSAVEKLKELKEFVNSQAAHVPNLCTKQCASL